LKRLGTRDSRTGRPPVEIQKESFFFTIDWAKLRNLELKPPWIPSENVVEDAEEKEKKHFDLLEYGDKSALSQSRWWLKKYLFPFSQAHESFHVDGWEFLGASTPTKVSWLVGSFTTCSMLIEKHSFSRNGTVGSLRSLHHSSVPSIHPSFVSSKVQVGQKAQKVDGGVSKN
jgi:hypothetical protein